MRRVLFVLEFFPPHIGGVETLFHEAAVALQQRGWKADVVTSALPGAPRRQTMDGIAVERVPVLRSMARYSFTLSALPASIRRARASELIHTTTYNAAIPAFFAARFRRKPCVITVHEVLDDLWMKVPGLNLVQRLAFRWWERLCLTLPFDHYLVASDYTGKRLRSRLGKDPRRITTSYPPVDYGFWASGAHRKADLEEYGVESGARTYLFFGRPGVTKGVEVLIEAAESVAREEPRARLILILGHYPANRRKAILGQIESRGLSTHAIVLDPRPRTELASILKAVDCVVVPSFSEGFGYSAVEAATLGCRVIATSGHATEEVIGAAARLVPAGDSAALADAIVSELRNPRTVDEPPRYTSERHLDAVTKAYDAILGQ
jgi:D-inositol-3-phosphate glycosyltransferase